MKKMITAVFAAAMAMASAPAFAATSVGQITAFDFRTLGPGIAAGVGANYADVNNSSFTLVNAKEWIHGGHHGISGGASEFGIQKTNSNVTAISGGLAGGASFYGGATAGALTVANLINN